MEEILYDNEAKRIPYGMMNFVAVREDNCYYVEYWQAPDTQSQQISHIVSQLCSGKCRLGQLSQCVGCALQYTIQFIPKGWLS